MRRIIPGIIVLAMLLASCSANSDEEAVPPSSSAAPVISEAPSPTASESPTPAPAALTPMQAMIKQVSALIDTGEAFDTGSYVPGEIPAGEYAFVGLSSGTKYWSEKDVSGDILDNENFDTFGYVYVQGTGNVTTRGALVAMSALPTLGVSGAKELWEILNEEPSGYLGVGMYKIGMDLPAGTYTLSAVNSSRGYGSVLTGPVGNNDIVDNEIFDGKWQVSVGDGQYLEVSRAEILQ